MSFRRVLRTSGPKRGGGDCPADGCTGGVAKLGSGDHKSLPFPCISGYKLPSAVWGTPMGEEIH